MSKGKTTFLSISYKVVATVFCLLLYLSYASVLIDPAVLPVAGFLGLYFIPVLLINVLLLLIALLRRSSSAWISLAAIAPAFIFAGSFFRITGHEDEIPGADGIKIMTWNVGGFRAGDGTPQQNMANIISLIGTETPQVVSLQEFRIRDTASIPDIFPEYRHTRHHFYCLRNGEFVGNLTLSTLPIKESGHMYFPGSTNMALYTDLEFHGHLFRLYNVHLESNNISIVSIIKKIGRGYDEFSHEFAQAHEKVKKSSTRRGSQVRALLDNISESGLPAVICGDVNDTPVSYCFRSLRSGRKDTFREAGRGFGATYRILWPLLRIDYVFVPENADVLEHRTLRRDYSDHYPVITEINMNENARTMIQKEQIEKAAAVLKAGGVILYPTDTIWGIGCDATNEAAVEKVFALKQRSDSKSLIILAGDMNMVGRYVREIPEMAVTVESLSDKPLTIIYPEGINLASNVTAEDGSIAIRIPKSEYCLELLRAFRKPIVSTSANVSGTSAPKRYADITEDIKAAVDFAVDPSSEQNATGKASSIIKLGLHNEVQVIRE